MKDKMNGGVLLQGNNQQQCVPVCYHPEVDSFPVTANHKVFYSSYAATIC